MTDERIERGAAEEVSDAPLTETEAQTAKRPASEPSRAGVDAVGAEHDPAGNGTNSDRSGTRDADVP